MNIHILPFIKKKAVYLDCFFSLPIFTTLTANNTLILLLKIIKIEMYEKMDDVISMDSMRW
jgi:hypothetical protein